MLVFLDTEFTDLLQPQLLSLGLAALNGREFYADLDLTTSIRKARVKASTDFVRETLQNSPSGVLEASPV